VRILGIDPGTANCGFALLEAWQDGTARVLDLGTFRSNKDSLLRERVAEFVTDVLGLLRASNAAVVVAEAPAFPTGAKAAAMVWAAFAGLTGVCQARGIELVLRNPGEWRKMLGLPTRVKADSRLRKSDTRDLVLARYPGAAVLLASCPGDAKEHAYDALAIATSWTDKATDGGSRRAA
jgi:hypothetical protein